MCDDRIIRRFAGVFILASLALGWWVHPAWFLFTAFVGLNLFQSAFTNTCPAMVIFRRLGLRECAHTASGAGVVAASAARH